jgi:hypothetical protein
VKQLKKSKNNNGNREIDICAQWKGMSEEEKLAQKDGLLIVCGHTSCIKESHIEPCATKELVEEAFNKNGKAKISAATLRQRLPNVLKTIEKREKKIYFSSRSTINRVKNSFKSFVELIEEKEKETKNKVTIFVSLKGE